MVYAQIIVIRSEDKRDPETVFAHREEFNKSLEFDPNMNNQARRAIEYSFEVQKALNACTRGLRAIGHMELNREIYKIRLMQSHYTGDLCLWEA